MRVDAKKPCLPLRGQLPGARIAGDYSRVCPVTGLPMHIGETGRNAEFAMAHLGQAGDALADHLL